jgi:ABC-type Zn uptake system ZnuABC Zn-binding protein ZnuA
MNTRSTSIVAVAAALALLFTACGGGEETVRGSTDADAPTVVASTGIAADIVANVGGDDIRVVQLVPDGSNPHSFAPSAKQQQEIEEAQLAVLFSPLLEEALPLDSAGATFAFADHVRTELALEEGEHGHEEEDGHEEEGGEEGHGDEAGSLDPHVWMDPTQIEATLPALADALTEINPENAEAFESRADEYAEELSALDSELQDLAAGIPDENRKLVTSHDLLGYFADRYGFEVVGAPFGVVPESEASAATVSELIDEVQAEKVPAVFAQEGDDPEVLEQIGEEAGVVVVNDLLVETFGDAAGSYIEMLRFSGGRIADSLSE